MLGAGKPLTDMASLCEAYAELACPKAAEVLRELADDYRAMADREHAGREHRARPLAVPAESNVRYGLALARVHRAL
jgi:hypothetical protein